MYVDTARVMANVDINAKTARSEVRKLKACSVPAKKEAITIANDMVRIPIKPDPIIVAFFSLLAPGKKRKRDTWILACDKVAMNPAMAKT